MQVKRLYYYSADTYLQFITSYLFVMVINSICCCREILLYIILFYLYVLILCIYLYLITVLLHACTCQKWQQKDFQSEYRLTEIVTIK